MTKKTAESKKSHVQKIVEKGNNLVEVTVQTVNGTTVVYDVPRKPIVSYDSSGRIIRR